MQPPADEPEFLEALMEGKFNKVLQQARDHIRTSIRKEGDRRERLEFDSGQVENYTSFNDQTLLPDEYRGGGTLETAAHRSLLVEQFIAKADIEGTDLKIIEFHLSGCTQEEIAENLSLPQ